MNINCQIEVGGLIFSKYIMCLENLTRYNLNNIENIKITNLDQRFNISNPFDYVFDVNENCIYEDITFYSGKLYKDLNLSPELPGLKIANSKFKLKKHILDKVDDYTSSLQITNKTLGVHCRFTDMNIHHLNDHGMFTIDEYITQIDIALAENKYENIFVSSDNYESISKLQSIYGDKISYCNEINRFEKEDIDYSEVSFKSIANEKYWIDTFVDMLLLSKCNGLLYRISNFANAVIIYSDKLDKFYRLKK